ncbi:MAG: hypothetical protein AAF358_09565 [Pseudomonadota bacterium]
MDTDTALCLSAGRKTCRWRSGILLRIAAIALALVAGATIAHAQDRSILMTFVDQAFEEQRDPGEVTADLLEQGFEPARAAQAVASAWGDCNAAQAAVAVAVTRRPGSATDVVTAVGTADGCGCGASSGWARSQLDQRIRFSSPQRPIELVQTCSCMAAAVEAGTAAAPQLADAIVLAGVEALQTQTLALDTIGERGGSDHPDWLPSPDFRGTQTFQRLPESCRADADDNNRFDPAENWRSAQPGNEPPAHRCDSDENGALLVREFSADASGAGHVWLVNHSSDTVDLAAQGYRIGIVYRDQLGTAVTVPLIGEIAPGGGFLVAGRGSSLASDAQQVVDHLSVAPGDYLDLHRPAATPDCECAEALTAAAFRGSRNRVAGTGAPSPAEHKMQRLLGTHEYLSGFVVDSVGAVSEQAEVSSPLFDASASQAALGRSPALCDRDAFELDPFSAAGWESAASVSGNRACRVSQNDLVIADLLVQEEGRGALRLVNSSAATIDMDAVGYYLEIYPPESVRPRAEIPLSGTLEPGASFVLAHDDIEASLREASDDLDNSLTLAEASAVVLARRTMPRPLNCQLELAAFVASPVDVPLFFIEVTPIEQRDPLAEPPRVDPPASPN